MNHPIYMGVDGCRGGWVVVISDYREIFETTVVESFADVCRLCRNAKRVAIDIPIGLLTHARTGGRVCDQRARKLLGKGKGSSVFSPPCRAAVYVADYWEALRINRESSDDMIGISKQVFNISNKIAEVDRIMTPHRQRKIKEVHPELAFLKVNGMKPLESKKTRDGQDQRLALLSSIGLGLVVTALEAFPRKLVLPDDIIDAGICCHLARCIDERRAGRLPEKPERDNNGLLMEMWF